MKNAGHKITVAPTAVAAAALVWMTLAAPACRVAEPFLLGQGGVDPFGSGGVGTLPVSTPDSGNGNGSGGEAGSGGVTDGGGSGGDNGSGDAPVDAAADTVVRRPRDAKPAVDIVPQGPLTLIDCYQFGAYKPGNSYNAGDRVFQLRDLRVFQCRPWPNSGWFSIAAYEPDGKTGYWPDAWTPIGYCE